MRFRRRDMPPQPKSLQCSRMLGVGRAAMWRSGPGGTGNFVEEYFYSTVVNSKGSEDLARLMTHISDKQVVMLVAPETMALKTCFLETRVGVDLSRPSLTRADNGPMKVGCSRNVWTCREGLRKARSLKMDARTTTYSYSHTSACMPACSRKQDG